MYILLVAVFLLPVGSSVTQSYGAYDSLEACEAAKKLQLEAPAKFRVVAACVKYGE